MEPFNIYDITLEQDCDYYETFTVVVKNATCSISAYGISGDSFYGQVVSNLNPYQTNINNPVIVPLTISIIDPINSIISVYVPMATINSITNNCKTSPTITEYVIGQYTINWLDVSTGLTRIFLRGKVRFVRNANSIG